MAINRINNTPIIINSYNARGLTVNHFVTKNCVRQSDGTLWALIGDYSNRIRLVKSNDRGFSWNVVLDNLESANDMREQAGFNADGLFAYLVIDERWDNLDIYMGEWESVGSDGSVERSRFTLSDLTITETNTTILTTTDNPFQAMFDISYNWEQTFLVWPDTGGNVNVTRCSPRTTSVSPDLVVDTVTNLYGFLSSVCDENGKVHIIYAHDDGSSNRVVSYVEYDSTTPSGGTPVELHNVGLTPNITKDLTIARDGLGTLCASWFHQNNTNGTVVIQYVLSVDSGATWGSVQSLTQTSGHADYQDLITGDMAGRTNLIGGAKGGFLLTYVEDNGSQVPRTYIRQLTTDDDGTTYDLGDEKEIATNDPWSTSSIVGAQFFHPPDIKLLDISDPGLVRIAFTIGEGDSTIMSDTVPVSFGQELLNETAFPTGLPSEATSYSIDTADSLSIRFLFNVLPGPEGNINFFEAGYTGIFTDKYVEAFKKVGTAIRLLRYEPDADNYLNDISAFGQPTEENTIALFDPETYAFPAAVSHAVDATEWTEWIEQDRRKLHLPPDKHLARTFLINKGGFLKRTVWLCEHDGNQYELSQIVPRFISNQICYYECNAYVVGPSRDPFSKVILPSET